MSPNASFSRWIAWGLCSLWLSAWSGTASAAEPAYKCVRQGSVTYQEQPCSGEAKQTQMSTGAPPVEAPPPVPLVIVTDEDRQAQSEMDRLQRETVIALQNTRAQFASHQAYCERQYGVKYARKPGADNLSVTGATYVQSDSASANAAAARCIEQTGEIQNELNRLRQQCAQRRCE